MQRAGVFLAGGSHALSLTEKAGVCLAGESHALSLKEEAGVCLEGRSQTPSLKEEANGARVPGSPKGATLTNSLRCLRRDTLFNGVETLAVERRTHCLVTKITNATPPAIL